MHSAAVPVPTRTDTAFANLYYLNGSPVHTYTAYNNGRGLSFSSRRCTAQIVFYVHTALYRCNICTFYNRKPIVPRTRRVYDLNTVVVAYYRSSYFRGIYKYYIIIIYGDTPS
jgi:hypothetical protein